MTLLSVETFITPPHTAGWRDETKEGEAGDDGGDTGRCGMITVSAEMVGAELVGRSG